MKYHVTVTDPKQLKNVEVALQILDPAAEISPDGMRLIVDYSSDLHVKVTAPDLPREFNSWEYHDTDIQDPRYTSADRPQRLKEIVRLGIISLLGPHLKVKPPWGILSGVRPTKIYHYLREKGFTPAEVQAILLHIFALDPDKTRLILEIGARQEPYLSDVSQKRQISIYIGIPFCPTRCRYCSFPAVSLETHRHLLPAYLRSLHEEIQATASLTTELDLEIDTVYLGGGTPTSLGDADFCSLLESIDRNFVLPKRREVTVEAGRPETISSAKLDAMQKHGVTRISINPQSMSAETLQRIGRFHSPQDIETAVGRVREYAPDLLVNMDLIAGLPGERGEDFLYSVARILEMQPANITIHTLAPKRASLWRQEFDQLAVMPDTELTASAAAARDILGINGYLPYYLYRQRFILAQQENIGYALAGTECIYNILMMEERQTILGQGAGAVTKWVTGPEHRVERLPNPGCPATYCDRMTALTVKKAQQSRILLG